MLNEILLFPAIPEIFLLFSISFILLICSLGGKRLEKYIFTLTQWSLVGSMGLILFSFQIPRTTLFEESFVHDAMGAILKLAILISVFFINIYSKEYIKSKSFPQLEYSFLSIASVLGMLTLVSAQTFLLLYLGLELMSLPLYALVAIERGSRESSEAALKYFVMGTISSGILLYGISLIYGILGDLSFVPIGRQLTQQLWIAQHSIHPMIIVGLIFILTGIGFKLAAAPFHMWAPDVYSGAPLSTTLFLATAPKLATFAILMRLLMEAFPTFVLYWQEWALFVAILSIFIGNVLAIVQTNIKRLLAYSAIAHIGYMLLGVTSSTPEGYMAAIFYMIVYVLMSLGAFGGITLLSQETEIKDITDLKGLNKRNGWLAFSFLLIFFSMAGIPPLSGFLIKFFVLKSVFEVGFVKVVIFALLMAVLGTYYYLQIIRMIYFENPISSSAIELSKPVSLIFGLNGFILLLIGIFPLGLMQVCRWVFGLP